MKKEGKNEGPVKRLKNVEDKSEEQLKAVKSENENMKEVTYFVEESLILEAKRLIDKIKIIQKEVDYRKLKITGGDMNTYDFSDYKTFKELFRDLYYRNNDNRWGRKKAKGIRWSTWCFKRILHKEKIVYWCKK